VDETDFAFLLSSNKFPAGQTELPADTDHLKNILFDKAPAAPRQLTRLGKCLAGF
jgi:hypothetical protein